MYRTLIESSGMRNNDESVIYTEFEVTYEAVDKLPKAPFYDPQLVFCRPVAKAELDAGLDTAFRGSTYDEKTPSITKDLDGLYDLITQLVVRYSICNELGRKPARLLTAYISTDYYDCMSGGMRSSALYACRLLIQRYGIDTSEKVYPSDKGSWVNPENEEDRWDTLADWMKLTDTCEFDDALKETVEQALFRGKSPVLPAAFPALEFAP